MNELIGHIAKSIHEARHLRPVYDALHVRARQLKPRQRLPPLRGVAD